MSRSMLLRRYATAAVAPLFVTTLADATEQSVSPQDGGPPLNADAGTPVAEPDGAAQTPEVVAPPPAGTIGTPAAGSIVTPEVQLRGSALSAQDSQTAQTARLDTHYTLEGIEIRGNTTTLASVILRSIPFRAGDILDIGDRELEFSRFRLLSTGFFRSVQYSLRKGSSRGNVVLIISVVERNTIVFNGIWLGLSQQADANGQIQPLSPYAGFDVSEINLAGTGATLGGAIAFAENQFTVQTRFFYPQFLRSNWGVEVGVRYSDAQDFFGNGSTSVLTLPPSASPTSQTTASLADYALLPYQRFGGNVGTSHDLGVSSRIAFNYRLERIVAKVPLAASVLRGDERVPIDFSIIDGPSILSTASVRIDYDTRDEPLLPTRGDNLIGSLDVSLSPLGSDYAYVKLQGKANHWTTLPWGHTLRLGAFFGAIAGSAPFFEKFYVGDFSDLLPDRVLDLNFDARPAPNFFNTNIVQIRYGSYAGKLDAEYSVPIYRGGRSVYGIDLFGSVGVYAVANGEDITNPATGYTGPGTFPADFTFNLGLRIDTQAGGFMFGLSNLLGLMPVRAFNQGTP